VLTRLTAGGGYQASGTLDALDTGSKVIIGGLFVQLIFFGIFIVIAVTFDLSVRKTPTPQAEKHPVWQRHMWALYIGSALIMVRSVFRAIEYLQGFNGYLLSHEAYLYIFDAVLMLLAMALFNHVHPSEVVALIAQDEREYKMDALAQHHHQRLHSNIR
jgi:SNF family Na+-dependent transporter